MEADESKIDYGGFTIIVKVNNPKYLTGKVNKTKVERGSGYLLFVNQSDGVQVLKHGPVNVLRIITGMVSAADNVNALRVMLANIVEHILSDDKIDLAKFYIQGADVLRKWLELQEGS